MEALELGKVTIALRLDPKRLDAAQAGALALVKATGELLRHCPDDSEQAHAFRTLLRWAQVLSPDAEVRDARRIADGAHPAKDPMWIAALQFDPRVSAAFPGAMIVAGLIAAMPREHSHLEHAWEYVRVAARRAGVSNDEIEMFRGWSEGSASEAVCEDVEQRLDALASINATCATVVRGLHELARRSARGAASKGTPMFLEARTRAVAQIDVVLQHAHALQVEVSGLERLRKYLEHDYFRVAVLGEFKRGKSTLINALLETPDLMPSDVLPCTSALTEIRHEPQHTYAARDPETNELRPSTEAQFRERVSGAATSTQAGVDARTVAETVPRWTVGLPNPFLRQDFVEIVDSPGLGEDASRDLLAKEEAQRADAAILVFNATQLASLRELELVDEMKSKLHNLIVVINQADLVPEAKWPRLFEHVCTRLDERRLSIPPERMVFVSALHAEEAVRSGRLADPWIVRMRGLRTTVQQHLLSRSGPLKAAYLASRIVQEAARGRADVDRNVAHRKSQLVEFERREAKHQHAREAHGRAAADIARATERLREHTELREALVGAFEEALPSLLHQIGETRTEWTTDLNPLFSPKQHVKAVSEQALKHTKRVLEAWFKGDGAKVMEHALVERLDAAANDVVSLVQYFEAAKGQGESERAAFVTLLKERTLQDAYEDATRSAADVDAFGRSVIVAVVSLVVAYILADVVLFYVLGAIASFLALPLLIAAVAVGTLFGWTKGDAFAREWVRDKIYDKIREQFQNSESRKKLREGIDRAMRDVSTNIARSFDVNCKFMLEEARLAEQHAYEELNTFAEHAGDRDALRAKITQLEALASNVHSAFTTLEAIAVSISAAAEGAA